MRSKSYLNGLSFTLYLFPRQLLVMSHSTLTVNIMDLASQCSSTTFQADTLNISCFRVNTSSIFHPACHLPLSLSHTPLRILSCFFLNSFQNKGLITIQDNTIHLGKVTYIEVLFVNLNQKD